MKESELLVNGSSVGLEVVSCLLYLYVGEFFCFVCACVVYVLYL